MGLFSSSTILKMNKEASKGTKIIQKESSSYKKTDANDLQRISETVQKYFDGSNSICIHTKDELNDYINKCIEAGIIGIDTETTGLDRIKDHIVGFSLYYPGGKECYVPLKHLVPIFDSLYPNQLTYEDAHDCLLRLQNSNVKQIYANVDFDLWFFWKDLKIDFKKNFYYDVILAWRCLKEDEKDNRLKPMYAKYVKKGQIEAKTFRDFFTPQLFPYSKPEVASLYAANDAKITYELFIWQLPYTQIDNPKCKRHHLQQIAKIIWGVEFPLVPVMQDLCRNGIYFDPKASNAITKQYDSILKDELNKLSAMVDDILARSTASTALSSAPFRSGKDFSATSPKHVQYLVYDLLHVPEGRDGKSTSKEVLAEIDEPVVKQIVKVRSYKTLINSFVHKLPQVVAKDGRIHSNFKQIGAATGRLSSENPNVENIPSKNGNIRHVFRGQPSYTEVIQNDTLEFYLANYDMLYKSDGSKIEVNDLQPGDKIQIENDQTTCTVEVVSNTPSTDKDHLEDNVVVFRECI